MSCSVLHAQASILSSWGPQQAAQVAVGVVEEERKSLACCIPAASPSASYRSMANSWQTAMTRSVAVIRLNLSWPFAQFPVGQEQVEKYGASVLYAHELLPAHLQLPLPLLPFHFLVKTC